MRRFVTLAILLLVTVPFGVSISGCSKAVSVTYCNGQNSGVRVGQTVTLDLGPRLTGISINQGAISSIGSPQAFDCKHNSSSAAGTIYASSNRAIVDVNPFSGSGGLCAGTWNRNTGTGIPDYTICTPNGNQGVAFVTASAQGVVSNPIAVYVHPIVTSIVLGTPSVDCANDPASNCFAPNTQTYWAGPGAAPPPVGTPFTGTACLSQTTTAQLAARSYAGTGGAVANISNLIGPVSFSAQNPSVVTINTNGLATATQPGSTIINAQIAQSSSTTGSFFTCPPASITLTSAIGTGTAPITVSQNVTQTLTATVTDTLGNPLNNISLEYVSTTPTTIPTSLNAVTPTFPGAATITAICQPSLCNPADFNQIGLFGNGLPVLSNPLQVTATGTNNSTVLYVASTLSQYLLPIDFTVTSQPTPVRLPYAPNSLVLSQDGTSIYMGTANELMVYSTASNSLSRQDPAVSGLVLASAPNNSTIVITDPVRGLTYLYNSTGGNISTQYGGVATSAEFSPDSNTVYITTTDQRLLVFSTFTGWSSVNLAAQATGVAVTVPNAGVYLAANPVDIHTNCPNTVVRGTQTTNTFYPDLGPVPGANDANPIAANSLAGLPTNNIASTNDGLHELAASPANFTDIATNQKSGACTAQPGQTNPTLITFNNNLAFNAPFTVATPNAINSILPTSDSAYAFVTYTGTGGVVPQYNPATRTLTNIPLQATAGNPAPIAPIAGVVSSDNKTFYVGTTGDNLVHLLTRTPTGFADTRTPINPALPSLTGPGSAIPNLIAQRPRKSTS